MYDTYSNKQKLCLDRILQDHGLYAPFQMNNNFRCIITLPSSSEILKVQSGQKLGNYSLENLQLEYETIDNIDLAQVSNLYSVGQSLSYEVVTLMKTSVWSFSSTLSNENVNIPRKSMRGLYFCLGPQVLKIVKISYIQIFMRLN